MYVLVNIFYQKYFELGFKVFLTDDFYEVGTDFGKCYGCDSFNEHNHSAAAFALDFYKIALGAIKCAAMDTYSCAFLDIYLFGAQVDDVFVFCFADGNELLHLALGDSDWDVLSALRPGVVLQEVDTLLECLDSLF